MVRRVVLMFPGQGSQYVGMTNSLVKQYNYVKHILDETDYTLRYSLTDLMHCGTSDTLRQTQNAQPAILTHIHVSMTVLRKEIGLEDIEIAFIGHSVGEWYSIYASERVQEWNAILKAVRARGQAMAAAPKGGRMCAMLMTHQHQVEALLQEESHGNVVIASYNSPRQFVISGKGEDVLRIKRKARKAGIRKCVDLDVSSAFHSPEMKPAEERIRLILDELEDTGLRKGRFASPTLGKWMENEHDWKTMLLTQLTEPVRWTQTIHNCMHSFNPDLYIEVGPGQVLSSLVRDCYSMWKPDSKPQIACLDKVDDLERIEKIFHTNQQ